MEQKYAYIKICCYLQEAHVYMEQNYAYNKMSSYLHNEPSVSLEWNFHKWIARYNEWFCKQYTKNGVINFLVHI